MEYKQDALIIPQKVRQAQNYEQRLSDIARDFREKRLKIPKFQRDFCWTKNQIEGWIESVISQKAIGVIVTYQLEHGGDIFVADGLQRLTATNYFIDEPSTYHPQNKKDYSTKEAIMDCESFFITVQHRIYKDHHEAMKAFRKLNSGTSLVRGEFYEGEIALIPDIGDIIVREIPSTIEKYESTIIKKPSRGRGGNDKLSRDCYAIFLQYISKTTSTSFWDSGTSATNSKKIPVEQELAKFIKENEIKIQKLNSYISD